MGLFSTDPRSVLLQITATNQKKAQPIDKNGTDLITASNNREDRTASSMMEASSGGLTGGPRLEPTALSLHPGLSLAPSRGTA